MDQVVYFDHTYQLNKSIPKADYENMESEINEFISYVQSKKLSPIEEIMLVYDRVKLLEPAESNDSLETRNLPNVIKNKKAVCVGYTSLFNEYLRRLGYKNCFIECFLDGTSHMYSMVEIHDDKYNIHGIYLFDPTFDTLEKDAPDRTISYAFFGRTMQEMKSLKKPRIPRGRSVALVDGFTDSASYENFYQELPLLIMNVINGFFPTEENRQYLQTIYSQGGDPSNWRSLNERYISEFAELNQAAIRTNRIPLSQIETIIRIIRQLERTETSEEISQILQFNN